MVAQVERELDRNEQAQKQAQREQDGSEIRSVELERMLAEGQTLIERRNDYEIFRDHAADLFERQYRFVLAPQTRQGGALPT
ncbi:hypothetical protein H845_1925 [Komagataeibacter xylinus E25]|nr:hypothetical protein H845_1925 [Komagataeibacter xylinus E25]